MRKRLREQDEERRRFGGARLYLLLRRERMDFSRPGRTMETAKWRASTANFARNC